jgi:hypothetical protein
MPEISLAAQSWSVATSTSRGQLTSATTEVGNLGKGTDDLSCQPGPPYVESFPNPHAGAPISDQFAPLYSLEAYLQATGPFADLENFDAAQHLMSSEMTNGLRDWYLDSRPVSS